jgi:hypothetical protein
MMIVANFNMSMTPEGVYDDNGKLMLYSKYTASETNFKRIKNKLKFNGNVDLSKIDSEQLAMWFNQTTPDIEEIALVNGTETYPNILMDKNGNILYTI